MSNAGKTEFLQWCHDEIKKCQDGFKKNLDPAEECRLIGRVEVLAEVLAQFVTANLLPDQQPST